jgi:hypothetical protein
MANITKTINDTAGFVPEIWANKALEVLRANTPMARLVARDTDMSDAFSVGDTLHIPYPGTFAANDKAADAQVTLQTPTGAADLTVVLNKHKEVSFIVEDAGLAQANPEVLDRYIDSAVVPLAEAIEGDLLGLYTDVVAQSVGTAGVDLTAANVRAARKMLNAAKVPGGRRSLVLSTKDEDALLGDANLQNYFANARPEAIAEGSIGRMYGFDLYMSQLVKTTGAAPVSTHNIAFRWDAFLLAMRRMKEPHPNSGVSATTIKDPKTGLMIRVLYGYNMAYLGWQVTLDVLYGVKTIRAAKAVRVLA